MHFIEKIEFLKNKEIISTLLSDDDSELTFTTSELDNVKFFAFGDFCSQSWIEHFEIPDNTFVFIDLKKIEIPPYFEEKPTKKDHSEEFMEYYFYELTTNKGTYLIEMRNSSNGYYGGYLE